MAFKGLIDCHQHGHQHPLAGGGYHCGRISEMELPRLEKSGDMPKATVTSRG